MSPGRRNRTALGAAAGLLSAAAGVGASLFVSVLAGGSPTPVTAVGSRVIDATPGAVKDWAVDNLGTNDKPLLLTGIFTVVALLAALTGIIAWRSRRVALGLTAALGLVGLAAAAADRTTLVSPLEKVLPAAIALVVSVGALWWFTRGWDRADIVTAEAAPASRLLATERVGVAAFGGIPFDDRTPTPQLRSKDDQPDHADAKAVPDGPGSVSGMAEDPIAVAASNNPLLKTLVAAVSGQVNPKVDLVDTLNGDEFTVFAPVDEAFAKIDPATLNSLKKPAAAETLTGILTYHVLAGQIAPDAIVGTHKTVEGEDLEVTGSGDNLKVNGATVICGGVTTANATVYLIDSVMMPPSMS